MVARIKKSIVAEQHTSTEERERIHAAMDEILNTKPDSGRFIAFIGSFCIGAGFGALAGLAINYLVTAALALTGSAFLATCVWVLGWALALYAVINYVPTYDEARGTVVGWFNTSRSALRSWVPAGLAS